MNLLMTVNFYSKIEIREAAGAGVDKAFQVIYTDANVGYSV